MIVPDKPSLTDVLEHHGVKGMKWGVNKVHGAKVEKQIAVRRRVASGHGSALDKAKTISTTTAPDLIRGKGLKGAANIQANRGQAHLDRINTGHAKARDVLAKYGGLSGPDIVKAAKASRTPA